MAALPTGTVTFLFTDVTVSTKLWERARDGVPAALARHDVLHRGAVELISAMSNWPCYHY